MPKNYYIILGIPADSSQADIKNAFRRLAKEYHPDLYGANKAPFQLIHEAYSVLSDPQQRRSYDKSRMVNVNRTKGRTNSSVSTSPITPEPLRQRQSHVESMRAVDRSIHAYSTLFDGLFDRMLGNFAERPVVNEERSRTIEVWLTPEQASAGGNLELLVPFQISCPNCLDEGGRNSYSCWRCNGTTYLRGEKQVMISYPPGVGNNHTIILPVTRVAGRDIRLTAICKIVSGR